MGTVGRIFTALGLVLLAAAWLWWLYAYRSAEAFECLYLPGSCAVPEGLTPVLSLPPYEPMLLWAGAAAVLIGSVIRLVARG